MILLLNVLNLFAPYGKNITYDSWNILGLPLAIYIFENYKINNNYFEIIMKLNDNIDKLSFNDVLSILNIKGEKDFSDKMKKAFDGYAREMSKNCKITKIA